MRIFYDDNELDSSPKSNEYKIYRVHLIIKAYGLNCMKF